MVLTLPCDIAILDGETPAEYHVSNCPECAIAVSRYGMHLEVAGHSSSVTSAVGRIVGCSRASSRNLRVGFVTDLAIACSYVCIDVVVDDHGWWAACAGFAGLWIGIRGVVFQGRQSRS